MAVWLIRAGAHGEYESRFVQDKKVYLTWNHLNLDLKTIPTRAALGEELMSRNPDSKPKRVANWVSQVWPFVNEIEIGDLVVLPLKSQRTIQIGEVTGKYQHDSDATNPFYHFHTVKWIGESIPRSNFGNDLLNTFGAFLTICRVQRNNAEHRINAMRANNWKAEKLSTIINATSAATATPTTTLNEAETDTDLEEAARDQIAKMISAKFKGHNLTRLVEGILKAQGYTTYRSPEGADGGVDILAGSGPLGFGSPRLAVEVKSENSPIDRPTVDKLLGAISKFGADEGLFVAYNGFKSNVQREYAASFFRVRLWTQKELLETLFAVYDQLDEDLKAELPLKRIWTVAVPDEEA